MPSPFGAASDYSGVFASLGREQINEIDSAVRRAAGQAATDQNAIDQDTYSKWKAGEISDEQWLAYIRDRMNAAGGDPVEQQKWADMLRTNEAAIMDSQVETQFRLGKISAQALLSHYRKRMADIEANSPAYRDLAERYQQVVDYTRGGSSGSGGGGGGGGSGASLASYIEAQQAAGVGTNGYDQSGIDVIAPASDYYGIGSVNYYLKTLEADKDRMKDMMDQYKNDPTLPYVVDHMTGQQVPVTPDFLRAIDNQYLRNQDSIALVYDAKGDPKGATAARTEKGTYISTYMVDHNTDRIEPAYSAFQKTVVALFKGASDLPPDEALTVFQQIGKITKDFFDGAFPGEEGVGLRQYLGDKFTKVTESSDQAPGSGGQVVRHTAELPPELKASGAFWNVMTGWEAMDQAINNPALSDEERQYFADEAIRLIPGSIDPTSQVGVRGERDRLTENDVRNLLYGDPNIPSRNVSDQSQLGPGFTGAFARLEQIEGLDNRDPSYDGQRFVFSVDESGSPHVVPAKSWPNMDGSISLSPLDTVDRSSLVRTVFKVGASTHVAYATTQVIPPNLLPKQALVYRATAALTFDPNSPLGKKYGGVAAGGLIPSDVIEAMGGMSWINGRIRQGAVVADSPFSGVVVQGADGPIIWYRDPKTGLLSTTIDLSASESDKMTGGVHVSVDATGIAQADINDIPFAKGSPIAFGDGFSRKEMIAITRDQIASGQLDPSEFSVRGEGTSVTGASTADELIRGFGPPSIQEIGQMNARGSWGRGAASKGFDAQAKKDQQEWAAAIAARGMSTAQGGVVQDVVSSINEFTSKLGIRINPMDALPDMGGDRQRAPEAQDPSVVARNDAIRASTSRQALKLRAPGKVGGLQPMFEAPAVNFAPLPSTRNDGALPPVNPVPIIAAPKVVTRKPADKTAVGGWRQSDY